MPKPWPKAPVSKLRRKRWPIDGRGTFRLTSATPGLLADIDRTWPVLRPNAMDVSWSWYSVGSTTPERWVVTLDLKAVGAFVAGSRLLKLPEGLTFRLDFLETRGDVRGKSVGAIVMALVAKRAVEAGASMLVLSALPRADAMRLYEKAGGQRRGPKGWKTAPGLLPFTWERDALGALARRLDDVEEEDQGEGSS